MPDKRIKICSISIKNFRSIRNETFLPKDLNIFVGLNDVGKSNVLKALNLFFNKQTDYNKEFSFESDFTYLFPTSSHGKRGALVSVGGSSRIVPGYRNPAVDTTGAGDAFWGGFLHRMVTLNKRPEQLTMQQASDCADWGNAVATCCVQKRGAIPAMPTLDEVKSLMLDR